MGYIEGHQTLSVVPVLAQLSDNRGAASQVNWKESGALESPLGLAPVAIQVARLMVITGWGLTAYDYLPVGHNACLGRGQAPQCWQQRWIPVKEPPRPGDPASPEISCLILNDPHKNLTLCSKHG